MAADPDLLDLLRADHDRLRALAGDLLTTDDARLLRRRYAELVEAFREHEALEEEVLVPALAEHGVAAVAQAAPRRQGAHEEVHSLLAAMEGLRPTSFAFTKRAVALALDLEAHLEDEELVLLPAVLEAIDPEVRAGLGRRAHEVMRRVPAPAL